jgi:hypothetical protein
MKNLSNLRVAVTGALGGIGIPTLKHLQSVGAQLVAIDLLDSATAKKTLAENEVQVYQTAPVRAAKTFSFQPSERVPLTDTGYQCFCNQPELNARWRIELVRRPQRQLPCTNISKTSKMIPLDPSVYRLQKHCINNGGTAPNGKRSVN